MNPSGLSRPQPFSCAGSKPGWPWPPRPSGVIRPRARNRKTSTTSSGELLNVGGQEFLERDGARAGDDVDSDDGLVIRIGGVLRQGRFAVGINPPGHPPGHRHLAGLDVMSPVFILVNGGSGPPKSLSNHASSTRRWRSSYRKTWSCRLPYSLATSTPGSTAPLSYRNLNREFSALSIPPYANYIAP